MYNRFVRNSVVKFYFKSWLWILLNCETCFVIEFKERWIWYFFKEKTSHLFLVMVLLVFSYLTIVHRCVGCVLCLKAPHHTDDI
jgi:hypothetical protein